MAEQKRDKGAIALNVEKELTELEERLDRLRVLYEQYFLGFEKLEPSVPRKEVDRRLAMLRKENIRNTALRYRFNVVNQKYNTYSMHWTRVCRQIEEGTFKRHVKKAQERFGDGSAAQAARRKAKEAAEAGFDVDIDFEDLDSMDMDSVLEEADRAAAKYERPAAMDTVPPGSAPASAPPNSAATPAPRAAPSHSQPIDRVARPAALPAGAGSKPKLIRKIVKGAEGAPLSSPKMPSAPPDSAPTPAPAPAPRPVVSPSGAIRGPMPSAPSAGRIPVASPSSSSSPSGRMPIAAPPPPQSERRMPVPAAAPPPAPSERRMPVSPPGPPGTRPMIRPAIRPATQSKPDLGTASERPSQPQPQAAPKAPPPSQPMPRAPAAPPPAPSRPRAPLPLPSQLNRDEKK